MKALCAMLLDHGDALADALNADFGQRAKAELMLSELWRAKSEIDSALKHGKRWSNYPQPAFRPGFQTEASFTMKPQRRATGMWLRPATAKVMPQPFGGVGASGTGAYHGYDGFTTFSKMKPVLIQPRLDARALLLPPYGRRFHAIMRLMFKL